MLGAVPLLIAEDTVEKPGESSVDNTGQVEAVPDTQERKEKQDQNKSNTDL